MAILPLAKIIAGIKAGLSGNAIGRQLRAEGEGIGRARLQTVVSQIRHSIATGQTEPTKPLHVRPNSSDVTVMTTKRQSGYMQTVNVFTRDNVTGILRVRPWSLRTDDLLTRQDVLDTALDRFVANSFGYEETVQGAVYTGTLLLIPEGEQ